MSWIFSILKQFTISFIQTFIGKFFIKILF